MSFGEYLPKSDHRDGNYCQFSQYLMASMLSLFSGNKKIYVKQNKKSKKTMKENHARKKNVIISPLIAENYSSFNGAR